MATLTGTSTADTLAGGTASDQISGLEGNDLLSGGGGNDTIYGGPGDDTLDGGTGNDSLIGGLGNDSYVVDSNSDVVVELANEGTDTVRTSLASYTLGANVENLFYSGSSAFSGLGNTLDNAITGGSGKDTLTGGAGNDTLDGGSNNDRLVGGIGDDLYVVDNASDVAVENANEGTDTVRTSLASYTLGTNIENLAYSGAGVFAGTGNSADNRLNGGAGNDTLNGGLGNDTLTGGAGNDVYITDSAADAVYEDASGGTDEVRTTAATSTLAVNVENLTFTGTGNFSGTGNGLANVLTGGAGNDTLIGGAGVDTLTGGAGNDVYAVDNPGDVIVEAAGAGTDEARVTAASYVLAANVETMSFVGTGAFAGTGNGLDNVISGGAGADSIDGMAGNDTIYGGGGADTLGGGLGIDLLVGNGAGATFTYNVDATWATGFTVVNAGDPSNPGPGTSFSLAGYGRSYDVFQGSGTGNTLVLGDGRNAFFLEDGLSPGVQAARLAGVQTIQGGSGGQIIDLTSSAQAYGDVTIVGGSGDDILLGSSGSDVIIGGGGVDYIWGGTGNDTLTGGGSDSVYGGAGDDTLVLDTTGPLGATLLDGGAGQNTVLIQTSATQWTTEARAEMLALEQFVSDAANIGKTFTLSQFGGAKVSGTASVEFLVDGQSNVVNSAPSIVEAATTDALTVAHQRSIDGLFAVTDAEGDALTYSVQSGPAHGSVTFNGAAGQYTYQASNYVGADSFVLKVTDTLGAVTLQTVSVDVTNAGPVLVAGGTTAMSVAHNKSASGTFLASDADGDSLTYSVVSGPANGTVTFVDANGCYTYQAGNGVGADSFVLRVSDGFGGSVTQTVTVDVTNAGPVIGAGTTTTTAAMQKQSVAGAIVATDSDGDTLSYSLLTGPKNGTVTFTDANGRYVYQAGDAAGVDSFTIQVADGYGGTATQTVTVGVTGTLDLSASTAGTSVNIATRTAVNAPVDLLSYTIDVKGSAFADVITGDARSNVLAGGDGKDEVRGAGGNDSIDGGLGDDKLFGDDGNDYLLGGDGNDQLNGGAHNDTMFGGAGNDGFWGGGAQDLIFGGAGNDRIFGDGGADTIYGGAGSDTMTGGTTSGTGDQGNDTFVWERADVVTSSGASAGLDRVTDFGAGDRMDFTRLFASQPAVVSNVVHVTATTAGTVVSAAVGVGGAFVDVVVLDGVHGVTVDDLVHNSQLLV